VGSRFSTPVQTGPGGQPASCTMGTGSFPEVKQPGRGDDYPPLPNAEVKERVELYLYSPLWAFVACSRMTFTFTFFCCCRFCVFVLWVITVKLKMYVCRF